MPTKAKAPDIATEAAEEFATRDLSEDAARIFAGDLQEALDPVIHDGIAYDKSTGEMLPDEPYRRRGEPTWMSEENAPNPRQLHRKLAEVMQAVARIPKNGTAPAAMGGFKFVQVGDAAEAIRRELASRHVTMMPVEIQLLRAVEHETRNSGVMTTETYHVTWEFVDGDTGEVHRVQSVGTGADRGDKAAPKAQTNAMKYALLMAFLMPTGDDPELEDSSDRHASGNSRPVIEAPDNTGPVKQGGRQENSSEAQVLEIGRYSKRLELGPVGLAAVIDQALPHRKVPDFLPNTGIPEKTKLVFEHLKTFTHAEAATLVQMLIDADKARKQALADEEASVEP